MTQIYLVLNTVYTTGDVLSYQLGQEIHSAYHSKTLAEACLAVLTAEWEQFLEQYDEETSDFCLDDLEPPCIQEIHTVD